MKKTEAYILAGGKSSRMGQDKGLMIVNHQPMISYIISFLATMSLPIHIITAEKSYMRFGLPLIADTIPNMGPLGGLYTALQHAQSPYVLLLSCDMPLLNTKILTPLLSDQEKDRLLCYKLGEQIFPFPACYHVSLKTEVLKFLHEKKLKITTFLKEMNARSIDFTKEQMVYFTNLNSPTEIAQIEKLWSK